MSTELPDRPQADADNGDRRSEEDADGAQATTRSPTETATPATSSDEQPVAGGVTGDADADPNGPSTADLARAGEPRNAADDDASGQDGDGERPTPLFAEADSSGYRSRWLEVQTLFVDDPRQAVERADTLVAELMQKLAETFAGERSELEQQWDRGGEVSTEDLRVALQRYRSFFDRLLSL